MASGDSVQQIKDRLSIVDVVSAYVELHPAGKNMKGKSPFTNEKTPSFYVSPDRGMYYCFSSSQGGDIFTFVQAMEGVDFKGALKMLADKAGIELVPEDPAKRTERDKQYSILEDATAFFQDKLHSKKEAKDYLHNRGVLAETIAAWSIGYAPGPPDHGWRELKAYLATKEYTQAEVLKAGLIKNADAGKEAYDVFRDRVMFPIRDASGRVVAYSGRILSKDSDAPKYVNSPETELFNKSEILYGYDKAKHGIRNLNFSLIVEGQFDVVLSHQAGYNNTVAVSGTALTAHHVSLLQRLSNRVVLALDDDRAGIAAVKRAADLMLSRGMDVKVARMDAGKDPADMIHDDIDAFKKAIKQASHVVEYLLDVLESEGKDDRTFKLKTREEILPYIAKIPNKIDQEHFTQLVADRLKTTKESVQFEVERIIEKNKQQPQTEITASEQSSKAVQPQKVLSTRKKQVSDYLVVLCEVLAPGKASVLTKALEKLLKNTVEQYKTSIEPSEVSKLVFTLEQYTASVNEKQLHEDIIDKLNELQTLLLKEQMQVLRTKLQEAETAQDQKASESSLSAIVEVQKAYATPYTAELFEGKKD